MGVLAAAAVVCALVLVCSCESAFAGTPVHQFLSSFGSFSDVQGVAVESETGTVYVYDGGASLVYKFDAVGNPVSFTATGTNAIGVGFALSDEGEIAVDSSSGPAKGDIYVAHADGSIEIFNSAGEKIGQLTEETGDPWGEACGVAVDASGAVYVGLYASHINKYVPSSNPVTNADYVSSLEGLSGVCNVAADSADNAYSVKWRSGPITRYEPGQFGLPFPSGSVVDEAGSTVAVDPVSDEVYVDERNQIAQYGPHGEPFKAPVMTFASTGTDGAINQSLGIAVSGLNGDVYVSDGKGAIEVFGPYEVIPVPIEEEYAIDVAGTSATIGATVNPEGSAMTYHFEYGPSSSYGSSTPQTSAGSGLTSVNAQVHLQGLLGGTVYHYRVVVVSKGGVIDGPDQTFTTQSIGSELTLLDERQWELVSPPNKQGAAIQPIRQSGLIEASEDGQAISYVADAPTEAEPDGYTNFLQVLSRRGASSWTSTDIATEHNAVTGSAVGYGGEYRFFSPDLSLALVQPQGSTPLSTEATEQTEYVRRNVECEVSLTTCYTPMLTPADVRPGAKFGPGPVAGFPGVRFVGATTDLRHVVLRGEMSEALTTTPGDDGRGLYEWSNGKLQLVSILPESEGGKPAGPADLGYSPAGQNARNAISADGSRIFWTSVGLYMRDTVAGETIRIGSGPVRFAVANVDGSRVFFVTGKDALEVCDIVEAGGKLTCTPTRLGLGVQGAPLGASKDGSYVYFASDTAMAPGAVSGTCGPFPPAGATCNLYVDHYDGKAWEPLKLVGVLSNEDEKDWAQVGLSQMTARVSPNGRWLAFMSQRNLTGYDTHDAVGGHPDEEVYVYDFATDRVTCASCDPTGARPVGTRNAEGLLSNDSIWYENAWLAADIPGWTPFALLEASYQSRYLSDEGRLFFNSGDALVPQDVNGTWDVYEYEPPGIGSCSTSNTTYSAPASGCVDLVSSGASADQSTFIDASGTGDDVFFLTSSHLATQDFDTSYDLYDAHVCAPDASCAAPLAPVPACSTGDSCKAPPSPQPSVFGAPPSATFSGIGNVSGASPELTKPRSLTRAQRLARALKACHRKTGKRKRTCERHARRLYRAKKAMRGSK